MEPTAILLGALKQNWWLLPIVLFLLFVKSAFFKGYYGELFVIDASRLCPKCGSSLVVRTVKSGQKAGSQFWGCSTYPQM